MYWGVVYSNCNIEVLSASEARRRRMSASVHRLSHGVESVSAISAGIVSGRKSACTGKVMKSALFKGSQVGE